jgi:Zn-dependent M28 family amino/carboxypeptidase
VLVAFGPRPAGSAALAESAGYITGTLVALGWAVDAQAFELHGLPLRNLVARANVGRGPVVILGAHYDTRPVADRDPLDPAQPYLGANDGASGTAVLLELARTLDLEYIPYEVWLVFFDGEDRGGLDGWDYAEGARRFAADLAVTPAFVIVVDMVGDREQQLPFEENSTPEIRDAIWAVAARLGYGEVFLARPGQRITDDHVPFLERGIKAVDIIDFDYPYWHTAEDTADKVSADSLARVGRTLEVYLEQAAPQP